MVVPWGKLLNDIFVPVLDAFVFDMVILMRERFDSYNLYVKDFERFFKGLSLFHIVFHLNNNVILVIDFKNLLCVSYSGEFMILSDFNMNLF